VALKNKLDPDKVFPEDLMLLATNEDGDLLVKKAMDDAGKILGAIEARKKIDAAKRGEIHGRARD